MSQIGGHTDNHKMNHSFIPSCRWGEDFEVNVGDVKRNLLEVKEKIAPCKPRIIGVTKYFGLDAIVKGYEAGLRDFGESRALEAVDKIKRLPFEVRQNSKFHFIGHLQTNKADVVVENFDVIHSLDSLKLARVISNAACRLNKREKVLIQVNNAREEQKFGYDKEHLRTEFQNLLELEGLEIVGLMNMTPIGAPTEELRRLFAEIREFRDELQDEYCIELSELSMGMSNDYEIAVQEGATIIRIGRKMFN